MDCLYWARPGAKEEEDALVDEPDLAERTRDGGFSPAGGKYASPFLQHVRTFLLPRLVKELAREHPHLDGLVLRCGFPPGGVLGFSDGAREAYRRAKGLDPKDFAESQGAEGAQRTADWTNWRMEQVGGLVKALAAKFREVLPGGKVAALGTATFYRASLAERNETLDDWLPWAVGGSVDEVLLDCRRDRPINKDVYAFCRGLATRTGKSIPLTPVLVLRDGRQLLSPAKSWAALGSQAAPAVVLRASAAEDVAAAADFWHELGLNPAPAASGGKAPRKKFPALRADPALAVRLTLDMKSPTVPAVLGPLRGASDLPIEAGPGIDLEKPAFGSISWRNAPAWQIMEQVAQSPAVGGRWEQTDQGYRLLPKARGGETAAVSPSGREGAPPALDEGAAAPVADRPTWWWLAGGGLALLVLGCVVGGVVARRRLRSLAVGAQNTLPSFEKPRT